MTRQNDRLNLNFHRYLHLKFWTCTGYLSASLPHLSRKDASRKTGNELWDLMPSVPGQQCILHYKVLSGNTFLEEMVLRFLNKRAYTRSD